jgi:Macrocin-O-methyltransferase (TylF)
MSDMYLDLMKKSLLASIYPENSWYVLGSLDQGKSLKERVRGSIVKFAWSRGLLLVKPRGGSIDWGLFCYTMIGLRRLNNIQECVEDVLRNRVEGDFIETGVWRGGATIFMRAILKAHGVTDRTVWVADSFEGLPALDMKSAVYADDAMDVSTMNDGGTMQLGLAVSLERVKANFERFDLLDDQVRFLKGWFCDTLPTAPIQKLAILRLDGDMYASTMDALNALYGKVSKGGYVIVDDYNCWPHCKKAVDDFRSTHGISAEIITIDEYGVYWKV